MPRSASPTCSRRAMSRGDAGRSWRHRPVSLRSFPSSSEPRGHPPVHRSAGNTRRMGTRYPRCPAMVRNRAPGSWERLRRVGPGPRENARSAVGLTSAPREVPPYGLPDLAVSNVGRPTRGAFAPRHSSSAPSVHAGWAGRDSAPPSHERPDVSPTRAPGPAWCRGRARAVVGARGRRRYAGGGEAQ